MKRETRPQPLSGNELKKIIDGLSDKELMTPGLLDELTKLHSLEREGFIKSLSNSMMDKLDWIASVSSFMTGFLSYLLGFGLAYAFLTEPSRTALQGELYYFAIAFLYGIGFGLTLFYIGWIFVVGAWFFGMMVYRWRGKSFRSLQQDILRKAMSQ